MFCQHHDLLKGHPKEKFSEKNVFHNDLNDRALSTKLGRAANVI